MSVPPSIRIFRLFPWNLNTIYGENSKNTGEKRAKEGVASITTNGGVPAR